MVKVIGVRFRTAGKIYYFDPLNFQVKRGDHVIVETARGVEYGTVVGSPREVEDDKVVQPLKPVLRVATERDDEQEAGNKAPLFTASDFSFKECMELRKQYDMSEPLPTQVVHRTDKVTNAPPLSFGCNFTQKQMAGIVSCANTYNLFCVSMLRIEDMEALFSCKEGFHIRVNNLRHVAILFDALLENSFIQFRWQSVLDRGKFLQSKDGSRFVSASSLSSALSAVRGNMTSVAYIIRQTIGQLKE